MLNDRSSIISLLQTRRSGRPRDMTGPAPSDDQLATMIAIAARTPDHGALSPWRFITVGHERRHDLAELFDLALDREDAGALPAKRTKAHALAHSAGALIVLVSAPVAGHKIPQWEQELSCGAAGMNLLLAGHALGFVGGWITGWQAYSPTVSEAFCQPGERIAGFIFVGHPAVPVEERPRADLSHVAQTWRGDR